jgi:hypothetical protein
MNPLYRHAGLLVVALAFGAGPGCADSGTSSAAKAPGGAADHKPQGWVTAPPKPNGSGVVLKYSAPEAIKPGEVATVKLQFSNVQAATGARLEVRASDPAVKVVVEGGTLTGPLTMVRGDFRELEVQVSAAVDGLYYLSVFTTQEGRFTATSIPLRVGSGESRQKAQGKVLTTPSGEKVVSLPGK